MSFLSEGNLKGALPYLHDLTSPKSLCPIGSSLRIPLRQFTPSCSTHTIHSPSSSHFLSQSSLSFSKYYCGVITHQEPALHSFLSGASPRGRDTRFLTSSSPSFFPISNVICFSGYHILLDEVLSNYLCKSFFIPSARLWIYYLQKLVGVKRHNKKVLGN